MLDSRSLKLVLNVVLSIACFSASIHGSALQRRIFEEQMKADTSIYSATVVGVGVNGTRSDLTESIGTNNVGLPSSSPNSLDSVFRVFGLSELWVAVAAHRMALDGKLKLGDTIDIKYTPLGVVFTNPITNKPITPQMLLSHTSLMQDVDFELGLKSKPSDATPLPNAITFAAYAESYFFTDATTKAFKPTLWITVNAGTTHYYSYSRSNTLLLSYVLDKMIQETKTNGSNNLQEYIANVILDPLGQSDTFYLGVDGSFPYRYLLSSRRISDLKTSGSLPSVYVHPSLFVDYNMFSSVLDLSRIASSLFLLGGSTFFNVGKQMLLNPSVVPDTSTTKKFLQSDQGTGVQFYDAKGICDLLISSKYITNCAMNTNTNIWGWTSLGKTAATGILCTDYVLKNPFCVVVAHAYMDTDAPKSVNVTFLLAGATLHEAIATETSSLGLVTEKKATSALFGFLVFLGVFGVLLFVPLAACLTEYVIQPAPMIPPSSQTNALPQRKFDGV